MSTIHVRPTRPGERINTKDMFLAWYEGHAAGVMAETEEAAILTLISPVPELEGRFPVVLYFGNDADRQEFVDAVRLVKPNLVARQL